MAAKKKTAPTVKTPTPVASPSEGANGNGNYITNSEIRDIVLAQEGHFQASDIEAAIKSKLPSKAIRGKNKITNTLFELNRTQGLLKVISPRVGRKGAVYAKI